jgi:hypothetical protein
VVVALAILALGMTSAIALFAAATAAHRIAIHRSHAADLAEWAIADIESALLLGADPAEIAENPPLEAIARDWPGYRLEVKVTPAAGDAGEDEALIEVGVIWQSRGRDERVDFQQVVARRGSTRGARGGG